MLTSNRLSGAQWWSRCESNDNSCGLALTKWVSLAQSWRPSILATLEAVWRKHMGASPCSYRSSQDSMAATLPLMTRVILILTILLMRQRSEWWKSMRRKDTSWRVKTIEATSARLSDQTRSSVVGVVQYRISIAARPHSSSRAVSKWRQKRMLNSRSNQSLMANWNAYSSMESSMTSYT